MARLILHLFGSPRMEVDGAPVKVDTRKATALLAYLAVTGDVHQRDSLAALLWPDYDQTSARAALRRTLSTLHRGLEGDGDDDAFLEIARESIGLARGADLWLDVGAFHARLASLSQHGHAVNVLCPACLQALEEAARLYREPFMAGFNLRDSPNFEEWQFFQEETLRRELAGVLEKLVFGFEASGQTGAAIQYARRWLALDPLSEEVHRQLMLLYARDDQRNAALRQYSECVRILEQELGVTPLEETTRLYQAVLNRNPLPEPDRRLRYFPGLAVEKPPQPAETPPPLAPAPLPAAEPAAPARPLVGRQVELARLEKTCFASRSSGCLATLEGEAGIGKTRLAEEFLERARANGARVIQARCYSGEAVLAYAPFIAGLEAALAMPEAPALLKGLPAGTLAEASRLLPEIAALAGIPQPSLPVADGAQARFFEALRHVIQALLAGPQPGILFLDDLHWADSATLDLLAYLARRLNGLRWLILAAWRSEPGETVLALERLVGELSRGGRALRLPLRRLGKAEMVELVRAFPGPGGREPEALAGRLYQESEGLPFVAVEYLATLSQRGSAPEGAPENWEMPGSVRDLLRSRLAGLDSTSRQLLSAAAVIGRSFAFDTLREASGRSEVETVDGLDSLLSANLVIETAGQAPAPGGLGERYDFTHEKLRALIYEETSLARRRLLHRRVAEALARAPGSRSDQAGLVAYHYEQAGQDDLAAEYHRLAGERARRLYANVEALAHFQAALGAGHADASALHEVIGDLHTLRGEYDAALSSYQAAAALCTPGCLAGLEHKLGNVHQRRGEWELAESHYLASLEAAGEPEAHSLPFHVHLFADRSLVAHARGDIQKAQPLAERSLDLARNSGDPYALAQAYNVLGVLARARPPGRGNLRAPGQPGGRRPAG